MTESNDLAPAPVSSTAASPSTKKHTRLRSALRLAAELSVVVWGLVVCNLSQIFGGMIAFHDTQKELFMLDLLALPLLTVVLIAPLLKLKLRILLVVVVLAAGLTLLATKTMAQPIDNSLSLFALRNLTEAQHKTIKPGTDLVLYGRIHQHSTTGDTKDTAALQTLVREETKLGHGLLWVKIIHNPAATLFD